MPIEIRSRANILRVEVVSGDIDRAEVLEFPVQVEIEKHLVLRALPTKKVCIGHVVWLIRQVRHDLEDLHGYRRRCYLVRM